MTWHTIDALAVDPAAVRVYAEGWQSWSPTTWLAPGAQHQPQHRPQDRLEHSMRFRPGTALPATSWPTSWQGEGLLVVDPGTGAPIRLYGDEDAEEQVTTVRATLEGGELVISAESDLAARTAADPVEALTGYGDAFAARAAVGELSAPSVWCSWYRYFENVTAHDVLENSAALRTREIPVDVVQIDDGWSAGLGEYLRPSGGFPSLERTVGELVESGRRVGIWLAPFLVGGDTLLARQHPDWLLGEAGCNWGQQLRALDVTHPGVRELLLEAVAGLRTLGVDYFKLDFLYAGAVPGRRHEDISSVAAYRSGLRLLREAAGKDAFLVGCGAPILPSVGLVDAMRVSPDTFHEGFDDGSAGLRGRMSLVARAWQHGRFWVNDPDCLVARPTYSQRERWAEAVSTFGGLRSCSDRVSELDEWGLETTRRLLGDPPPATPFDDRTVGAALGESR
jgi:alpha-galactosidase